VIKRRYLATGGEFFYRQSLVLWIVANLYCVSAHFRLTPSIHHLHLPRLPRWPMWPILRSPAIITTIPNHCGWLCCAVATNCIWAAFPLWSMRGDLRGFVISVAIMFFVFRCNQINVFLDLLNIGIKLVIPLSTNDLESRNLRSELEALAAHALQSRRVAV